MNFNTEKADAAGMNNHNSKSKHTLPNSTESLRVYIKFGGLLGRILEQLLDAAFRHQTKFLPNSELQLSNLILRFTETRRK